MGVEEQRHRLLLLQIAAGMGLGGVELQVGQVGHVTSPGANASSIEAAIRGSIPPAGQISGWLVRRLTQRMNSTLGTSRAPMLLRCSVGIWQSIRSEEHTSELQSRPHLVCRLLL